MFYSGSPYLGRLGPCRPASDPQRVRRVLHHRPQPRPVPDHLLGRGHDRSRSRSCGSIRRCRTTARKRSNSRCMSEINMHTTHVYVTTGHASRAPRSLSWRRCIGSRARARLGLQTGHGRPVGQGRLDDRLPAAHQSPSGATTARLAQPSPAPGGPVADRQPGRYGHVITCTTTWRKHSAPLPGAGHDPRPDRRGRRRNQDLHLHRQPTPAPSCTRPGCCPTPSTRWRWACTAR